MLHVVQGMNDQATKQKDPDREVLTTEKKLDQLYGLIDGIDCAMMTTRTKDGSLVSRPMSTQTRDPGTDLWFMTNIETEKCDEIIADPHVNLGYYSTSSSEWVSVNGLARVTQDRAKIRELYRPNWKAYLGDEGGAKDGGPEDPRIALIEVEAQTATYMKSNQPKVVTMLKLAKAMITGTAPKLGTLGELNKTELGQGEGRS